VEEIGSHYSFKIELQQNRVAELRCSSRLRASFRSRCTLPCAVTDDRSEDEDEALQLNAMSNMNGLEAWRLGARLEAWSTSLPGQAFTTESSIYILESTYVPMYLTPRVAGIGGGAWIQNTPNMFMILYI